MPLDKQNFSTNTAFHTITSVQLLGQNKKQVGLFTVRSLSLIKTNVKFNYLPTYELKVTYNTDNI